MANNMSKDDFSRDDLQELERRRLVEQVTESVERTLRKRYTWLGIVASFLIGSGVAAAIVTSLSSAHRTLVETEVRLKDAQGFLERARSSVEEAESLSGKIKEIYDELEGSNTGQATVVEALGQLGKEVKELHGKLRSLTDAINPLLAERRTPKIRLAAKSPTLTSALGRAGLSKYRIYLHYTNEEDRKMMDLLSKFLQDKGYVVPRVQRVSIEQRDIRFFHDQDRSAAEHLRQHLKEFITLNVSRTTDVEIPIKGLIGQYPGVRKGQLEVWLYL